MLFVLSTLLCIHTTVDYWMSDLNNKYNNYASTGKYIITSNFFINVIREPFIPAYNSLINILVSLILPEIISIFRKNPTGFGLGLVIFTAQTRIFTCTRKVNSHCSRSFVRFCIMTQKVRQLSSLG